MLPLPARLRQARDLAQVAQLAQSDTAHLELAVVGARTAGHFAAVANAVLGRVARQFGQLQARLEALFQRQGLVVRDRLQGGALRGVLRDEGLDLLVAVYSGLFLAIVLFPSRSVLHERELELGEESACASSSVLAVVQTMMSMPHI
jgi:hypothetical protein